MEGLNYLHKFDIAHRDIKMENIMLVNDDPNDLEIRIIDYGFA